MSTLTGFAAAAGAALAFGLQYVPVKKYPIYDGTTFQWFMCNGILFVGVISAAALGELESGCPRSIFFGGVLWGLSNFVVIPLVKLLGIGLGFSLYHFVNLMVGYITGRFGLFGLDPLEETFEGSILLCDLGCGLVLVSFVALLFVEKEDADACGGPDDDLGPDSRRESNAGGMEVAPTALIQAGSRRVPLVSAPSPAAGNEGVEAAITASPPPLSDEPPRVEAHPTGAQAQCKLPRVACGSFSLHGCVPGLSDLEIESESSQGEQMSHRSVEDIERPRHMSPHARRCIGVALAVLGGGLAGVQSVPAALYNQMHPHSSPSATIFPQCLGIWTVSSVIYVCYAAFARLRRWPVPHSTIRPAYISGCIWAVGFGLMLHGISILGYSVGYTLDAVGPIMVASWLSILVFREIHGRRQLAIYGAAQILQAAGCLLIATLGQQQ